ncbi:hypothetical protein [Paenibacillus ferrarius]|uniref:hypothetical protein n=1 Tax=Paenibacillus ferrarius TaxID=1469647 RepID=UPI001FC9EE34|nr:hypothetical protein [Paenibacillus ferrarius]
MIITLQSSRIDLISQEMKNAITGYWENDIWYCEHPIFDDFRKTIWDKTYQKINFIPFQAELKNEIKFFIIDRLKNQGVKLHNTLIRNYSKAFKHFSDFLNRFYPNMKSFSDLEISKAIIQLRSLLIEKGLTVYNDGKLTKYENLLNQLHLFFKDFYDTRDEFQKDIWDMRNIPGARIVPHESQHLLNFTDVPSHFRNMLKRYIKFRVSHRSPGQCSLDLRAVRVFLTFIHKTYPLWDGLKLLSRKDVEDYLVFYRDFTKDHVAVAQRIYLIALRVFFETIERLQYKEAPQTPIALLIFREDLPRYIKLTENDIKQFQRGLFNNLRII